MSKKKIIIVLCLVVCMLTVAYATLITNININGTASITSTWDLQFTSIIASGQTSGVTEEEKPTANGISATFYVGLQTPGDQITYLLTLKNLGTIDAIVNNITITETGNYAINFEVTGINQGDIILAGEEKILQVKIEYDSDVMAQPNVTINKLTIDIHCTQYFRDIEMIL